MCRICAWALIMEIQSIQCEIETHLPVEVAIVWCDSGLSVVAGWQKRRSVRTQSNHATAESIRLVRF